MQYGFCFARAIFDLLNPICSRHIAIHDIIAHNMSLHKGKVFTKSCNSASLLQFYFLLGNTLPCLKNGTFEKLKLGNSLPWRCLALALPCLGVALALPCLGVALVACLGGLPWWLALVACLGGLPWLLPFRAQISRLPLCDSENALTRSHSRALRE